MRSSSRRSVSLLVVLLLAVSSAASSESLERIREKGNLRVAVYTDFPPFSYKEDGRYTGMDIDIARALAKQLGVGVDLKLTNADENMVDDLRNNVWKGHYIGGGVADVMMHVPFDPEFASDNDRAVIFAPYFREQMAIIADPNSISDPTDVQQLVDLKVGVEVDSVADFYMSGAYSGLLRESAVRFHTNSDAVDAFSNREIQAVLAPRAQIEGLVAGRLSQEDYHLSPFALRGMLRSYWDIALAIKTGNPELQAALSQAMVAIRDASTLESIAERYGVSYLEPNLPPDAVASTGKGGDDD